MTQGFKPYSRKCHYYETDQMGVVHHSNHIRWLEEARIDHMDQMGFPYKKLEELGVISPVLEVDCRYEAMVRFGDTVSISTWVKEFTGVKYSLGYEIVNLATGERCAVAKTKHCYLDREGRPVSVKKTVPELHDRFMAAMARDEVRKKRASPGR
ncbi:acyl-CoA thioesterase [Anaerotalea alkaliphila]|uniref:Acyl-CoA thioesterase n=1 Tax=Anaerotalea alkaliphila TaxID=2662126 RepID=A0A7X5HUC6_9FIRM|nr:thioesterase family protein [Anaerotalea alkaliphila]NDL66845.1 acyl-CoA thioesterase [Anaerotalea alkaliphila]